MKKKFYITTPIFYVNDRPHIGHAYTAIAADILARYHRIKGDDVVFLTGTDENSQKTVEGAAKNNEDVMAYANRLAGIWKSTWESLNISNTDFIRTTEERHVKTVREVWKRIWENGDIYKGKYEGLYCKGHEAFMKESDLVGGVCPDHKTKPEWITENNYFFKLKKYEEKLLKFYDANPGFVTPESRFNEVKSFVKHGLEDISISREKQEWGIPVPNDDKHVIYVWFDALINYISAVGVDEWEKYPADVHAIGKDIVRFHAVIWPAMLMSAKLPLPKHIMTNGFFTIDGVKISKSLGNAIDPMELTKKYGDCGVDALRYFLLREIPYGEDGDFSEEKFKERYNADLANGLGNLVARIMKLAEENLKEPAQVLETIPTFPELERFETGKAIDHIWSNAIQPLDKRINDEEPFKLVKEDAEKGREVIRNLVEELYRIAGLLAPFLPVTSEKIKEAVKANKKPDTLFPRK